MITNQNQSINEWEPGMRYPHDVKLSILAELRTGLTQRAILKKHKISSGTLRTWIERFGPADMQCQKRLVTDQQRREGARAIIEGRMTITEVMEMHNLITRATVSRWVKDYKMEYAALATSNQNSNTQDPPACNPVVLEELFNARLKIAALETMIDVAEEQFKISIRKKPGAKQR